MVVVPVAKLAADNPLPSALVLAAGVGLAWYGIKKVGDIGLGGITGALVPDAVEDSVQTTWLRFWDSVRPGDLVTPVEEVETDLSMAGDFLGGLFSGSGVGDRRDYSDEFGDIEGTDINRTIPVLVPSAVPRNRARDLGAEINDSIYESQAGLAQGYLDIGSAISGFFGRLF